MTLLPLGSSWMLQSIINDLPPSLFANVSHDSGFPLKWAKFLFPSSTVWYHSSMSFYFSGSDISCIILHLIQASLLHLKNQNYWSCLFPFNIDTKFLELSHLCFSWHWKYGEQVAFVFGFQHFSCIFYPWIPHSKWRLVKLASSNSYGARALWTIRHREKSMCVAEQWAFTQIYIRHIWQNMAYRQQLWIIECQFSLET